MVGQNQDDKEPDDGRDDEASKGCPERPGVIDAQFVQDRAMADEFRVTESSVPVHLHTLLVRTPGRVQAAMDFARILLGVRTYGAAGASAPAMDADGDEIPGSNAPTPELARAKAAAFRTLENYFGGAINDELAVHATFRIKGNDYSARFIGQFDGETGRVLDPRYVPQPVPDLVASVEPRRDPTRRAVIEIERTGGTWGGQKAFVTLPPGMLESDVVTVEDSTRDPFKFRLTLKSGNNVVIDGRDGGIVG